MVPTNSKKSQIKIISLTHTFNTSSSYALTSHQTVQCAENLKYDHLSKITIYKACISRLTVSKAACVYTSDAHMNPHTSAESRRRFQLRPGNRRFANASSQIRKVHFRAVHSQEAAVFSIRATFKRVLSASYNPAAKLVHGTRHAY